MQIEFRLKNGLCRTIALQSFRITHLKNAENLAKFCTTRETKIKWKKNPFLSDFLLFIKKNHYNGFQINYNAFCFGEKKWI